MGSAMTDLTLQVKILAAAEQFVAEMNRIKQEVGSVKSAAESVGAEAGGSLQHIGSGSEAAVSGVTALKASLGELVGLVGSLAAVIGGGAMFKALVSEGLDYNATLETAKMGITSLIAAQSDLHDSQGKLLTGTEALDAAQALAEGQLQKLKIAGLQTSATFKQLAEAYQVAVGSGLGAGLNLDQIRTTTIQITQAAAALGVPMNQINQEVQSILSGTIDMNSRVAKSLGISNEMVDKWKAQNTLADELNKRLEVFAEMGKRITNTWEATKSNMVEAKDTILGMATAGMFDALKDSANKALSGLLDMTKGEIRPELKALIDEARTGFAALGKEIGSWMEGFVNGLRDASAWVEKNQGYLEQLGGSFKLLWDQVKGLVGELLGLSGPIAEADAQTGTLAKTMQVVAVFVGYVRDGVDALKIAFELFASGAAGLLESLVRGMALLTFGKAKQDLLDVADSLHYAAQANFDNATASMEAFKSKGDEAGKALEKLNAEVEKTGKSDGFKAMQADIDALNEKIRSGQYTTEQLVLEAANLHTKFKDMGAAGKASMDEVNLAASQLNLGIQVTQKASTALDEALQKLKVDTGHLGGGVSTFANEAVTAFKHVATSAGATGSVIVAAFNEALGKTRFEKDVQVLKESLKNAFDQGKVSANDFYMASKDAMARINVLAGETGKNFSKGFAEGLANFHQVAEDATSSAGQIKLAFDRMLDSAKTRQEVEAAKAAFEDLKATGKLSAEQIADSFLQMQDRIRLTAGQVDGALGDSFKRLGAKTAEAMKGAFAQLVVDFDRIKQSGQASAEGIDAAYQQIKSSVVKSIQAMTTASREALDAAKQHTTAVQAEASAISASGKAIEAGAKAEKALADYADAEAEAQKTGSQAALAKADALGLAADAARASAEAAALDAKAQQDAAAAAQAQEIAQKAALEAAQNPSEWNKQAAADAQNTANALAATAEESKQAAIGAKAMADELQSSANAASALAGTVKDAAQTIDEAVTVKDKSGQILKMFTPGWEQLVSVISSAKSAAASAADETAMLAQNIMAGARASIDSFNDTARITGSGYMDAFSLAAKMAQDAGAALLRLEELTDANSEAMRRFSSAIEDIRGQARSVQDEINNMLGRQDLVEQRAYDEKRKEIEAQLKVAQAQTFSDPAAKSRMLEELNAALANLDTLHGLKMKNIADEAAAKKASDKQNHDQALKQISDEAAAKSGGITPKQVTDGLLASLSKPVISNQAYIQALASQPSAPTVVNNYDNRTTTNTTVNVDGKDLLSPEAIHRKIVPELEKLGRRTR